MPDSSRNAAGEGPLAGGRSPPGAARPGAGLQVGVLGLQGDFPLHLKALERLGVQGKLVRLPQDLQGLSGLILPGGESTTMVKLAKDYGLFEGLREAGRRGLPMFGTCAGAILLGQGDPYPERLALAPVVVRRNGYGRQRESFEKRLPLELPDAGRGDPPDGGEEFLCVFIRAPKMEPVTAETQVLGRDGADPVLCRHRNFLLSTFHPELTEDLRIHRLFLTMCEEGGAG